MGAAVARGQTEPPPAGSSEVPFHDFRQQPLEYAGPEADGLRAEDLDEIAIGWFGPSDPAHPEHGDLWTAANLAFEQANRNGGWNGIPFRLTPRWSENVWGSGVSQVVRLAYEDQVWAILGSVDGSATHLAEQVVVKARLPLVSPVSTDESVNLAGVPWMFSVVPGDHLWATPLAETLVEAAASRPFAMVTITDHDSRLAADALMESLAVIDQVPAMRLDLPPGARLSKGHLEQLDLTRSRALLLVAGPEDGSRLTRSIREHGFSGPIFGTPRAARRRSLEQTGDAKTELRVPFLLDPISTPHRRDFVTRFRQATGYDPDWAAMHTYDAGNLLIDAIRRAGPSRTGIRKALIELSPWQGVTGIIEWDPTGQNQRPVTKMATARGGRLTIN